MLLLEIFKLNSLHWSLFLEKLILQPTSGVAFCISVVLKIKEEDAELHVINLGNMFLLTRNSDLLSFRKAVG